MANESAGRDELSLLLDRIDDPRLRVDIAAHVALLRRSRRFGLVFDRHLPEAARLPKMKPRAGDRVARRDEADTSTWRVLGFTDRTRSTARLQPLTWSGHQWQEDGDPAQVSTADVVVVRDHGESIHPGLVLYDRLERGQANAPTHIAIEGENLHALQLLKATHGPAAGDGRHGLVDLVYIDPPYNTGNKSWIYNDRYVDAQDQSKSSKWLSFMERRLRAAKPLLKDTGVVIAAIGDDEHHRLRMLMDQVFGAENFISDVVWQGGRKNDSRYVSNGADYMLVYAKDETAMALREVRWRESKPGVDRIRAAARKAWAADENADAATASLKQWFSGLKLDDEARGSAHYSFVDDQSGRPGEPYFPDNMRSPNPRPNLQYDLVHPVTGKPCNMHPNGWVYSRATMDSLLSRGRIRFGKDESTRPNLKRYLDENDDWVALSSFVQDRRVSARHLKDVFNDKRFPNPKDHNVLARWINLAAPSDAVILDFFGGSGSTMEAVLRLNEQDSGMRQCILVTNNELAHKDAAALRKAGHHPGDEPFEAKGVFRHVAHPRIKTVVTGVREDGSTYGEDGLAANVAFYILTQLDPGQVRRGREFAAIAPILWMQAGGLGPVIDVEADDFTLTDTYGVLFNSGERRAFAEKVTQVMPKVVFIVTDSRAAYRDITSSLPSDVRTHQLYESYLSNFEVNTDRLEA